MTHYKQINNILLLNSNYINNTRSCYRTCVQLEMEYNTYEIN